MEYGWKPHRVFVGSKRLITGLNSIGMREKQKGTLSSNSRSQAVPFRQYSTKLSPSQKPESEQASPRVFTALLTVARASSFLSATVLDSLRGSSVKIGTMQIILAWPLRKDDTQIEKCKQILSATVLGIAFELSHSALMTLHELRVREAKLEPW